MKKKEDKQAFATEGPCSFEGTSFQDHRELSRKTRTGFGRERAQEAHLGDRKDFLSDWEVELKQRSIRWVSK